ncbi:hypothetical protein CHX27_09905, partial [Flavobacterium aurantiibacter]
MKFTLRLVVSLLLVAKMSNAQNLLTNGDFEAGTNNTGFNVNGAGYNFLSPPYSGTTASGDYAFVANPNVLNTNFFLSGGDHTTGTGLMMVIDGNATGGAQKFWRAGTNGNGVCALNTNLVYEFSFWAKSVGNNIVDNSGRADIRIQWNNATNVQFVSPASTLVPLPADGWQKFTYRFKPTNACVYIELYNENTAFVGNDFAVDDFSVRALLTATISPNQGVCQGPVPAEVTFTGVNGVAPYTFTYTINGGAPQTVSSSASNSSVIVSVPAVNAGVAIVNLVSVTSSSTTSQVGQSSSINVVSPPTVVIGGPSTVSCPDSPQVLTFTGTPGATVSYTNGVNNFSVVLNNQGLATAVRTDEVTTTYSINTVELSGCEVAVVSQTTIQVSPINAEFANDEIFVCPNGAGTIVIEGTPNATVTYTVSTAPTVPVTLTLNGAGQGQITQNFSANTSFTLVSVSDGSCTRDLNETASVRVLATNSVTITPPPGSICPGESYDVLLSGPAGATITLGSSSSTTPISVTLDAQGNGSLSPIIFATTTFTLQNISFGPCASALTGSATVNVLSASATRCLGGPQIEVEIRNMTPICQPGECTNLTATYYAIAPTTTYVSQPIPFQQVNSFTGGTVLQANQDDIFSPVFTLPFNFNFYGVNYNQLVVGSNGVISFNTALAGQFCPWAFNQTVPPTGNPTFPILNAIYGVYQDTNIASPPVTNPAVQNVNYYVQGTAPNRVFVANFNELPLYDCNATLGLMTSQIVLYETTNIVDVIIKNRVGDCGWNGGNGIVGVQNATGTAASISYQTGDWNVSNQAVRLYPTSTVTTEDLVTVQWTDQFGTNLGTTDNIVVCPTQNTTYTVTITTTRQDNTVITATDSYTVIVEPPVNVASTPENVFNCDLVTGNTVTFDIDQIAEISGGDPNLEVNFFESLQDAKDFASPIPFNQLSSYAVQVSDLPKELWVSVTDFSSTNGCYNYLPFVLDNFSAQGTIAYTGGTGPNQNTFCAAGGSAVLPTLSPDLLVGGIYSVTPSTGLAVDPFTGAVNVTDPSNVAGTYQITYTVTVADCPPYTTPPTEFILDACCVSNPGADFAVCSGDPINLSMEDLGPTATYSWSGPNGFTANTRQVTISNITVPGDYVFTANSTVQSIACDPETITITVLPAATASILTTSFGTCTGSSPQVQFSGTSGAVVSYQINGGVTQTATLSTDASGTGTATITVNNITADTTVELVSVSTSSSPICSQTFVPAQSITITVGLPTAVFVTTSVAVCPTGNAQLEVSGTPGSTVNYTVVNASGNTAASIILDTSTGVGTINLTNLTSTTTVELVSVSSPATPPCTATITGQSAVV